MGITFCSTVLQYDGTVVGSTKHRSADLRANEIATRIKLICRIDHWTSNATKATLRLARVHQFAFCGPDGKVRKTISDPTSKLLSQ